MNLIIVAGMPATGKTTLSKKIANRFGIPMLEKDEIKEEMYKTMGYTGLKDRAVADVWPTRFCFGVRKTSSEAARPC